MWRASVMSCLLLVTASAAADETGDLAAALTTGTWVKDISNPKMPDHYVYTFAKDGTYKSVFFSDFTPRPTTTGRWELVKKDNKVHLRLKSADGKYAWLREDSMIRYDKAKDVLLVSGEGYAGDVPLRHDEKAK